MGQIQEAAVCVLCETESKHSLTFSVGNVRKEDVRCKKNRAE